jgi:adenosylmethionine-8-amino-7-oxononanoate aminotransferase
LAVSLDHGLEERAILEIADTTALSLGRHERRRAHFTPLFAPNFHAVSPCYAYRHQEKNESDQEYVKRLADELEAKFQALGPDTVAAFFMEPGTCDL